MMRVPLGHMTGLVPQEALTLALQGYKVSSSTELRRLSHLSRPVVQHCASDSPISAAPFEYRFFPRFPSGSIAANFCHITVVRVRAVAAVLS